MVQLIAYVKATSFNGQTALQQLVQGCKREKPSATVAKQCWAQRNARGRAEPGLQVSLLPLPVITCAQPTDLQQHCSLFIITC